ncbi:uncharacterized protein LOC120129249 [Hibiscus syriacus]|uniref:uncharacterized protein LOC120129249 n=1 Tax=Hibiscus syriacus TaxID=106335 RepID=UPI001924A749|nr:uncharacterized protein LOC120129249 [Hibiscus syriacus]
MDEDQRATKKVRNKEDVDRMEEDHADLEAQSNTDFNDKIAGNQGKHSYASAVMGNSKTTVDVVSLKAMDEVEILDGDCIVDNNGSYPVIHFADQVHDRIDYSMRRSVIVRLLGRAIGYKTLLNRIGVLWQLQGQYQLIDLENDYFLVKFEREEDYVHVLMEGPWTIFGSYLTVQPWSRTFSTLEKHPSQVIVWVILPGIPYRYYSKAIFRRIAMVIGQVVKIDYSMNSGERGRFARLAVLVNLNKPLIPCLKIDGFWQKIEYEGLQQICFQCGVYGHSKENCGSVEGSTRHEGLAGEPSVEEVTAIVSDAPAEEHNKRNGEVYASRMENQAKGKVVTDSVPLEASSGRRTNTNRKEDVGDSRALNQISVIAMEEGAIPQVTKSRHVTAGGSHSVVSISDDSRNNIIKRSNREMVVEEKWGKVTLHDEGSSVQRENEHENYQGAESPKFRRHLREHCRESRPDLVALLETRISGINADKVIWRLGFQNSFRVEAHGFSGGIWILWKDGLNVEILTISNQFIHGRCWSDNENRWLYFTAIYASPQVEKCKLIWKHLTKLMPGENEAWLLEGDFNSILQLDERECGSSRDSGVSQLFVDFVFEMELFEVDYQGLQFTWRRGNLFKRLDRCLMNSCWANIFPGTMVIHLGRVGSDHCPLVLKPQSNMSFQSTRPFRFIAAWQDHPQFKDFLSEVWRNGLDALTNVNSFQSKASEWNLNVFGHIGRKKRELLAWLRGIDRALITRYSQRLVDLQHVLEYELEQVLQQEESLWLQKSRTQWVLHGDKNTKYFHACKMMRRRRNHMGALKDMNGNWVSEQATLCSMAVNFYKDLFTSTNEVDYGYPFQGCFPVLSNSELNGLIRPLLNEEIREVLFSMSPLKDSGVDGLHAIFFQRNWDTVSTSVCQLIQSIFAGKAFDKDFNRTLLVLIPKVKVPESFSQYQPISLCFVLYKLVTKIIVNRLKSFMKFWISENQTSFVPECSIMDNVIIAQEVIHSMRLKKGKVGFMAIKIDLEKAYDRLEWLFVEDTLRELHIPKNLRRLIMRCVSSVSTHVLWNGAMSESFKPTRGLRQGDPRLNCSLCAWRGSQEVQNLGKYLGVPLLHSRVTRSSFSHIISRVRDKLTGWKAKSLSLAGRITLAKTVLSTIPFYSMQSMKLPKGICDDLEQIIRGFIWGRTEARNGISLVNWENVCKPISNGGLGMKKLIDQNDTFLMKLAFKLATNSDHLWIKVLRSKYRWRNDLPDSIDSKRSSHVWKGISHVWSVVRQSLVWNIGNGCRVDFWGILGLVMWGLTYACR